MLDNIIFAYRSEFYDWNLKKTANFYKKNKKFFFWTYCFSPCFYSYYNMQFGFSHQRMDEYFVTSRISDRYCR